MEEPHHRGADAQRCHRHVGRFELPGRNALRDDACDRLGDRLHVGGADFPALLHRDFHHLMQLGIADIALRVHAVDGGDQFAQAKAGRSRFVGDGRSHVFDLAHQDARDTLVDRLFRIEKAIHVGRAHPQLFGDVGDRGLLIADLPEQPLRHHENPLPCVRLDMFGNQRHDLLNVQTFSMFNYSAASASGNAGSSCCGAETVCWLAPLSSRLLRNQSAYGPGRYSKVRKVATNKPPMMVIAIGPQNAERDSGIIARIAASAVSTTGRARRTVASTIASLRLRPWETSLSIWSTKITALRMIMPASAISPNSATKPNGWLATLRPSEAPTMPSGAVRKTRNSREKLWSWIINSVSITMTISGNSTKIEALPLADSSNAPPGSIR